MSDDLKPVVKYWRFSSYLKRVLERRDLRSADAARICDIDTTVMFRWWSGRHLPKSWESLEPVIEKLRFTSKEALGLRKVYQVEILGEEQSKCFNEIMETFHILEEKRTEYSSILKREHKHTSFEVYERGNASVENCKFLKLDNKTDVWQCIETMLLSAALKGNCSLYLKLHFISELLIMQLKRFCESDTGSKINILVCGSNGADDLKSEKLKRMKEMLDVLIQKKPVDICCYSGLDETGQTKQNWIVSEDFFIQFTDDMSHGMITREPEWIAFFRDSFGRMKERCTPICKKVRSALEYTESMNTENQVKIVALEYMPCLSIGLTEEILVQHIYAEAPFREKLIESILAHYPNGLSYIRQLISYFTKEGLIEFMESGIVEIFPYEIYEPLNLQRRCEILRNIISISEEESAIHFILLKEDFLNMKGIHVEQRTGDVDVLNMEIHFEENKKEEIEIVDPDIRQEYERFFEYLKESSYIYSEEDTLVYMKEVLAEYWDRIEHGPDVVQ